MEPLGLWKVERQVVGQQAMPELCLGTRDHVVRLRQLLKIVQTTVARVAVDGRRADPEHVQDHLGILRIVLVPAVVEGLASAGECHARDQSGLEPGAISRCARTR